MQQAERAGPDGEDWALPGRFGAELWHRARTGFSRATVGGDRIALPADPLTLERLGARGSACPHPGPFPVAFRHCPECGATLAEPPPVPAAESWSPPFGAADGLPSLDERRLPDPESLQEIVAPASAALGYGVAGTPPMLLACDRVSGWISGWSEGARTWVERVQIAGCSLPGWSWSASASPAGLALPTDHGPAWIGLAAPRAMPVTMAAGMACLGGAASLRSHVAIPVQGTDGPALAVLDRDDPGAGWRMLPVPGAPAEPVAAPVVAAGLAIWCGRSGQLGLAATADGLRAHWRPWRDGLQPLPGVRPLMERNGTLHQLARLDASTLVLEGLAAAGQVPERRPAEGYALGTGRAVFREAARLRSPADEREAADYPLPDGDFLLPLLAFDPDRYLLALCSDRAGLGGFVGDPDAAGTTEGLHRCVLHVSRGPRALQPLDAVLRARHAWDLSVFLHAGWLWVHGAVENRLLRWRLDVD